MDLRQLRTFHAVAELGSLSKASDQLHLAQPALSRHIRLLEHELRTALFNRNGRGMVLTEAGRLLLTRTSGWVQQMEQLRDDMVSLNGTPSGKVALGIVPTASAVLAGRMAQGVTSELPNVALRLVEGYGGYLIDWLHRGEIDLAVIYGQAQGLHLNLDPLASDELMIVGPPGSNLEKRKTESLSWLSQQRLVLPSKSHGLRQLIEHAARKLDLSLNVMMEADSFRALVDFVKSGGGYTVLPPSAIQRERREKLLEAVPLREPHVVRHLMLAWSMDRPLSLASQAIAALLKRETAAVATAGIWSLPK